MIEETTMVTAPRKNSSMAQAAGDLQRHVDIVCLDAMEMQLESPDRNTAESILNTLRTVKELAIEAGAHPVVEAAALVEEAVRLALTETSAPAPYLGHFITSEAADLSRVVHAVATGTDPTSILDHARATLSSMPRRGTDYLVEVDLNNAIEVARIFEAMGDSAVPDMLATGGADQQSLLEPQAGTQQFGRLRELRQLLASYVAQTETLRSDPNRGETLDGLLVGAKALRASASAAGMRPVERLSARLAYLFQSQRSVSEPPAPDVIEFCVACGHAIASALDSPTLEPAVTQRIDSLIAQVVVILRRFNVQADQVQTGMLIPPESHPEPGQARTSTIYDALQLLEHARGGETNPRSYPGPGRSRGDPQRFLRDVTDVAERLPPIIENLKRDRSSVSSLAALWDVLLKLKESSALAGASVILDQCWRIESMLNGVGGAALTDEQIANLLSLDGDLHWLISQVQPETDQPAVAVDASETVPVDLESFAHLARLANELMVRTGGDQQRSRRLGQSIQDISVVGDRLGALINRLQAGADLTVIARELSEMVSDLAISAAELEHIRIETDTASARVSRVVDGLTAWTRNLRLTPVTTFAQNIERAVRGLGQRHGKSVSFVLDDDDIMVNTAFAESLNTALLHLVRNAVGHGIERPNDRRTRGKPEQGTVSLRARRDGSQVVLEVSDDGNGIDERLVVWRAKESGYPVPSGVTRERALQLIFLPGIAWNSPPNGQPNKGHGLDSVSQLLAGMKGTVAIDSEVTRGTTVTIRLPLTVPTTSAVVVTLAGEQHVLPFVKVQVVPPSVVRSVEQKGTTFLADLGPIRVPIVDLGALLGLRGGHHVRDAGGTVLRVQQLGSQWLIKVDEVLGVQEVEMQLAENSSLQPSGVVGTALLESGTQATVLDLDQLLDARRTARRRKGRQTATLARVPFALVADMSITVRRELTLALEQAGWRVVEARDGLDAWELLESLSPELLVIDLDLPLLDPFQIIGSAKANGATPVLAIVSHDDPKVRAMALNAGVNAVLPKPVNPDDLIASLKALGFPLSGPL